MLKSNIHHIFKYSQVHLKHENVQFARHAHFKFAVRWDESSWKLNEIEKRLTCNLLPQFHRNIINWLDINVTYNILWECTRFPLVSISTLFFTVNYLNVNFHFIIPFRLLNSGIGWYQKSRLCYWKPTVGYLRYTLIFRFSQIIH